MINFITTSIRLLGTPVGEVASLLAIAVALIGGIGWFTRVVIVNPLKTEIKELNGNLKRLSNDIASLQKDNRNIYNLIDEVEKEVASKGVMFEQQIKTLFERLRIVENQRH